MNAPSTHAWYSAATEPVPLFESIIKPLSGGHTFDDTACAESDGLYYCDCYDRSNAEEHDYGDYRPGKEEHCAVVFEMLYQPLLYVIRKSSNERD